MATLLIDDHALPRAEARKVLEQILAEEIIEFSDPQEALQYYIAHRDVDLIITDIIMSSITGIELAEKALEHRTVPIVFHTGSWARDPLYLLVFRSSLDNLPIEIANKAYFFPTGEGYSASLEKKIRTAQEKAASLLERIDITPLTDISRKLRIRDTFVDYVKTIYDELFTQLWRAITCVPEEVISAEMKAKITKEKPDVTQQRTDLFLHNLRYPLQTLNILLAACANSPQTAQVISIVERMRTIKDYIETEATAFSPSMIDVIAHKKALQQQTRRPLLRNNPPTKLVHREKMLQASGTPYIVIKPEETYSSQAESLFTHTGKVIIRSMSAVEDNTLPFAGYFDSVVVDSPAEIGEAIQQIRSHHSRDLEQFCLVRGYELPTAQDMTVLLEPWRDTKYIGAVLEHPTQGNLLLIEIMPRNDDENKQSILYDRNKGEISINESSLPRTEINHLAEAVINQLDRVKTVLGASSTTAYQMEICFTRGENTTLYCFQLRSFQAKQQPASWIIQNPLPARTVFGATTQEGIECIIATTNDPIQLDLISQRARAKGLHVAYSTKEGKPNVPFCTAVDVLITGKDLAVQAHAYFNPLSQASHAVLLTQTEIAALALEQGTRIRYTSNGIQASITKLDTTEAVKYRIRDILNQ